MRGFFLNFEGGDGSGKSAQMKLLVDRLRALGREVETISFPQHGAPSAKIIDMYLRGEFGTRDEVGAYVVAALYARDRQTTKEKIQGWLNAGKIVIADRFVASAMAYESAFFADPKERTTFRLWVEDLEFVRMMLPRPNLTLIMSVPADLRDTLVAKKEARAYTAGQEKDMHERDRAYQENVEIAYRELANQFPNHVLIDCITPEGNLPSIEDCHGLVWPHVERALQLAPTTS
ncbi:MAG: hypothetical protein WC866_00290 [Patescibacteria group bacterium]|jgi:dTMP kinase